MKAPDLIALFHCPDCGRKALDRKDIRPHHWTKDEAGEWQVCGGAVEEKTYQLVGVTVTPSLAQGTVKRSPRKKVAA